MGLQLKRLIFLFLFFVFSGCQNDSLDHESPRFVSSSPEAFGWTAYNIQAIQLKFSESIDPDSTIHISVKDKQSNEISGSILVSNHVIRFEFTQSLLPNSTYIVEVTGEDGIRDLAGNSFINEIENFSFMTNDFTDEEIPKIISTMPNQEATEVLVRSEIILNYNREIDPQSVNETVFQLVNALDYSEVDLSFKVEGTQVQIVPVESLQAQTTYFLNYGNQIKSIYGVPSKESGTLTFKTGDRSWGTPQRVFENSKSTLQPRIFQLNDGTEIFLYVLGKENQTSQVYVQTKFSGEEDFGAPQLIFETASGPEANLIEMKSIYLETGEVLVGFLFGDRIDNVDRYKIETVYRERNGNWRESFFHDLITIDIDHTHWDLFLASDGNGMVGWVDEHELENSLSPTFYVEKMIDQQWPQTDPVVIQTLSEDSNFLDIEVMINNSGNAVALSLYYDVDLNHNRILYKKSINQGPFNGETSHFINEYFPLSYEPLKIKSFLKIGNQNILFVLSEINGIDRLRYLRFTDEKFNVGQSGFIDLPSHEIEDFWYHSREGRETVLTISNHTEDPQKMSVHAIDRLSSQTGEFTDWSSIKELYSSSMNMKQVGIFGSPRGDQTIFIQTVTDTFITFESLLNTLDWQGTGALDFEKFDIGNVYGISGIKKESGENKLTFKTSTSLMSSSNVNYYFLTH
ncbi:MAG: hypothetical protein CL678_09965 [Bdellovibrionaceae bacterium]|nr:hypothetical protein [Pseudobdellovibrionaceae bacterium]|tara:strand:+ start:390 stop:2447 length:2058 start_codon:yes stop_codon:yes gene_type:complete